MNGGRPQGNYSDKTERQEKNSPQLFTVDNPDKPTKQFTVEPNNISRTETYNHKNIHVTMSMSENLQGHYVINTTYSNHADGVEVGRSERTVDKPQTGKDAFDKVFEEQLTYTKDNFGKVVRREIPEIHKNPTTSSEFPSPKKLQSISPELLSELDAYYLGHKDLFLNEEIGSGAEKIVYKYTRVATGEVFVVKSVNAHGENLGGLETILYATYTTISGIKLDICEYIQGTNIGESFFASEQVIKKTPEILHIPIKILNLTSSIFSNVVFNASGRWEYEKGNSSDRVDASAHFMLEENLDRLGVPFVCIREKKNGDPRLVVRWFQTRQIDS